MGAHNIEHVLKGQANEIRIQRWFKDQQAGDALENGHQSGYSGDFQTVHEVKYHFGTIFKSYNEAHDYCLDHAEKWSTVIAVYYLTSNNNGPVINTLIAGWGAS